MFLPPVSIRPAGNAAVLRAFGARLALRTSHRNFGVSGSYGASIYGVPNTVTNSRLIRLPTRRPPEGISLYPRLHVSRWPGAVRALRAGYFFRDSQRTNTGYYQMLIRDGQAVRKDLCFVANVDKNLTRTRTIESCVSAQTRGFVGQVLLHGRGVKAYFEPEFPHLMFRLGVGSKCIDATRVCTMYSKYVRVEVDRTGTRRSPSGLIISVHGYNKMMVGNVVYRIFRIVEANPYTMKGGHIAGHPIAQKIKKKR